MEKYLFYLRVEEVKKSTKMLRNLIKLSFSHLLFYLKLQCFFIRLEIRFFHKKQRINTLFSLIACRKLSLKMMQLNSIVVRSFVGYSVLLPTKHRHLSSIAIVLIKVCFLHNIVNYLLK